MRLFALQRWAHVSLWEIDNMNPISSDKASSRKSSHPKKLITDTSKNVEPPPRPSLTLKQQQLSHTLSSNECQTSSRSNYQSNRWRLITGQLYSIKVFISETTSHTEAPQPDKHHRLRCFLCWFSIIPRMASNQRKPHFKPFIKANTSDVWGAVSQNGNKKPAHTMIQGGKKLFLMESISLGRI